MTSYQRYPVICACGHEGRLVREENDAPFTQQYEIWHVEEFASKRLDFPGSYFKGTQEELLTALEPRCPSCGEIGRVRPKH
jgi:hypothetical protein